MLTTGFEKRMINDRPYWNDYLQTSFYPAFVNLAVGYLAGDADVRTLNWTAGQVVTAGAGCARFPSISSRDRGWSVPRRA
jgi:hypothetical protein